MAFGLRSHLIRCQLALIFYEYAITIDNEVRLIWRRRITGASVIFFLNRYIMIADSIITIASFPAMSNLVSCLQPIACLADPKYIVVSVVRTNTAFIHA